MDQDGEPLEGRGQYSKYTKDNLLEAIEKIRNNQMSYGEASRTYNVPKTTLYNKMNNMHNSRRGATTTLTKAQEDELAEWILTHQSYGDPRTKQDIVMVAGEIAQLDDDVSNHFKNGIPTSGWVDGFLKRHPEVVYRKPEAISKASAINTKEDFSMLWRNIYAYFQRINRLDLLHKPEHWWNADETNFPKDPVPKRVFARKGCKNVHRREQGNPKGNTTATYAFSAVGDYIEPLITLKDSVSTIAEIAFALGSVGANFALNQTDSGWMQTDSFYYYVTMHLHKQWELKNSPKPRILTIDGYRAHLSIRLFRWARLNDCIIIVLYPNGTPYLQMCDTTMFGPMKTKHTELYQQWRLKNPTQTSDEVVFVKLLKSVNDAVIRKQSIINGWRSTGLQPFDFNNLNCDDLLSKSPHYTYDFKGDHIDLAVAQLPSNSTARQSPINVNNAVLNHTSEPYIDQNDLYESQDLYFENNFDNGSTVMNAETFQLINYKAIDGAACPTLLLEQKSTAACHSSDDIAHSEDELYTTTAVMPHVDSTTVQLKHWDALNHAFIPYNGVGCVDGGEILDLGDEVEMTTISKDNIIEVISGSSANLTPLLEQKSTDLAQRRCPDIVDSSVFSMPTEQLKSINQSNVFGNQDETEQIEVDVGINLSELSGHNGLFRSKFDTNFNLSTFGITSGLERTQNGNKVTKIAEKIRRDLKELALLCAANDKEKLINVLIINQQLSVIDPPDPPTDQLSTEISNESRTIKTILQPPVMPQRVKTKTKRNIKVGYGVVTSDEVIKQMEEREISDAQQEVEREEDEIDKKVREKKIDDVDKQLKEVRELLITLKSKYAANVKVAAQMKKSKKRCSSGSESLLEETITDIKIEIDAKNDQLKELRDRLKVLKADHVLANKAVAVKRRNAIQLKKERGNLVMPSPQDGDDTSKIDF